MSVNTPSEPGLHTCINSQLACAAACQMQLTSPGKREKESPGGFLLRRAISLGVVSNLRAMLFRVSHSMTCKVRDQKSEVQPH